MAVICIFFPKFEYFFTQFNSEILLKLKLHPDLGNMDTILYKGSTVSLWSYIS